MSATPNAKQALSASAARKDHFAKAQPWVPGQVRDAPLTLRACHILRRPGGSSEEPEPDPIPNSAVKLLSADGTVSQDPGE